LHHTNFTEWMNEWINQPIKSLSCFHVTFYDSIVSPIKLLFNRYNYCKHLKCITLLKQRTLNTHKHLVLTSTLYTLNQLLTVTTKNHCASTNQAHSNCGIPWNLGIHRIFIWKYFCFKHVSFWQSRNKAVEESEGKRLLGRPRHRW